MLAVTTCTLFIVLLLNTATTAARRPSSLSLSSSNKAGHWSHLNNVQKASNLQLPTFNMDFVQLSRAEDAYASQKFSRNVTFSSQSFSGAGRRKKRQVRWGNSTNQSMRQVGRVGMKTPNTYSWMTPFQVGSGATMYGVFDTGSGITVRGDSAAEQWSVQDR